MKTKLRVLKNEHEPHRYPFSCVSLSLKLRRLIARNDFVGTNPSSIRGSKTGVFIGASASEAHEAWAMDPQKTVGYSMTGCTRSMFANRLSYFFDFKGRELKH